MHLALPGERCRVPQASQTPSSCGGELRQLSLGRRGRRIRRKSPIINEITAALSKMLFILSQKGAIQPHLVRDKPGCGGALQYLVLPG